MHYFFYLRHVVVDIFFDREALDFLALNELPYTDSVITTSWNQQIGWPGHNLDGCHNTSRSCQKSCSSNASDHLLCMCQTKAFNVVSIREPAHANMFISISSNNVFLICRQSLSFCVNWKPIWILHLLHYHICNHGDVTQNGSHFLFLSITVFHRMTKSRVLQQRKTCLERVIFTNRHHQTCQQSRFCLHPYWIEWHWRASQSS